MLYFIAGAAAARLAAVSFIQNARMPVIPGIGIPGFPGTPTMGGDGLTSPQTPVEEHKPLTQPIINLDSTTKVGASAFLKKKRMSHSASLKSFTELLPYTFIIMCLVHRKFSL